ncbi:MAG: DUF6516 family protein, partial [Elusimicrobiota bacterium]
MKAKLLLKFKRTDTLGNVMEIVVWSVRGDTRYPEAVKYRLAYIPYGRRAPVVLFDNHYPKGHHKHVDGRQETYPYMSIAG